MLWQTPFVEPKICNNSQLAFFTLIYAVVLYQASNFISSGSELLMLVPAVAGIVGSIVLPILGAVPDGMMVLFSAVGPDAQNTVSVGVGALAGSTVMLLTFPWFICIVCGRSPLVGGKADYTNKDTPSWLNSGITFGKSIKQNCKIMIATTLLFLIIQVPASFEEILGKDTEGQAKGEHQASMFGLVMCLAAFAGYLVYCFMDASEDKQLAEVIKGIERKQVTIAAALQFIQKTSNAKADSPQKELLCRAEREDKARLRKICWPFFKRYDYDKDGTLNLTEMRPLLHDLGFWPHKKTVDEMLKDQDENNDGKVDFGEFTRYLYTFMRDDTKMKVAPNFSNPHVMPKYSDGAEEEEEEAVPDDLAHLSPAQQMRRVIFRSIWMMCFGTGLVLAFSDPMVECLSEWGTRIGVSPFYVSFVLAPFASNASELLSAYTYATKKTEKNMTTALSTLVGAACMNNTFVFAIFLALIYTQGLAWQFTAETIAMILIQWIVGLLAMKNRTQTPFTAVLILLCYPGCLAIVWVLENKLGLD